MIESMLIVGGSRGVGAAVAEYFVSRVTTLYTVSRTPSSTGEWIAADLATQSGIDTVVDRVAELPLDALVFAGGTWETDAFTDEYDFLHGPADDIDRVIAVNLVAPIKLVRGLLPALRRARNPRALLVGALSGLDNNATREVANTASKAGLRGAAQAMHRELAGHGLAVTVVNPGNLATGEVAADIAEGRFEPQMPIPLTDFLAVLECALSLSPATVATEINLAQMDGGRDV